MNETIMIDSRSRDLSPETAGVLRLGHSAGHECGEDAVSVTGTSL